MMNADDLTAGRAAWQRLRNRDRATWSDWLAVGRVIVIGRTEAMQIADSNRPLGRRYNRAVGEWLAANGLETVNAQERYLLIQIIENLPAIEQWRNGLEEHQRRRFNHPGAIYHTWRREMRSRAPMLHVVKNIAPLKRSGRAIHWPSEALRRAATAIREADTRDTLVIARVALEAAIRSEADLFELLPSALDTSAQRQKQPNANYSAHALA